MDTTPFAKIFVGVLGQIGCSFISGPLCRSLSAGSDGIRWPVPYFFSGLEVHP